MSDDSSEIFCKPKLSDEQEKIYSRLSEEHQKRFNMVYCISAHHGLETELTDDGRMVVYREKSTGRKVYKERIEEL